MSGTRGRKIFHFSDRVVHNFANPNGMLWAILQNYINKLNSPLIKNEDFEMLDGQGPASQLTSPGPTCALLRRKLLIDLRVLLCGALRVFTTTYSLETRDNVYGRHVNMRWLMSLKHDVTVL